MLDCTTVSRAGGGVLRSSTIKDRGPKGVGEGPERPAQSITCRTQGRPRLPGGCIGGSSPWASSSRLRTRENDALKIELNCAVLQEIHTQNAVGITARGEFGNRQG